MLDKEAMVSGKYTNKYAPGMLRQFAIFLYMMTSSNGNIFRVTGHLCGEFTASGEFPTQRPVTRIFDVFVDLCLNKRLSKQSWGWLFRRVTARFVIRFNLWLGHDLWPHNASICDPARFVTKSASICDQRYTMILESKLCRGIFFLCLHL